MYQVTIKGRTLEELKSAVLDIHNELNVGIISKAAVSKDLKEVDKPITEVIAEAVEAPMHMTHNDKGEFVENTELVEKLKESAPVTVDENSELDTEGLPWDKRIHATTKTKDRNGVWKKKRGVDTELLKSVKDELRNAMYQKSNPPVVPPMPITETPAVPYNFGIEVPPVIETPVVVEAPVTPVVVETPVAPVAPVQPPMPTSGNGHSIATFSQNFPMILATLITEGKVTQDYVNQLKEYFNVTEIWNVSEAQKEEIFNSFVQFGFITKVG